MTTEDVLKEIQEHVARLQAQAVEGSLIFIDLANSTAFKTSHPEEGWLVRLLEFRETIKAQMPENTPIKFLGDGALCFFPGERMQSQNVAALATKILGELTKVSAERNYAAEYALQARVILDFGPVFMFDEGDPQGTPVDRLFKLEKFVPANHIGLTQGFKNAANLDGVYPLGKYLIRGIGKGRHELFLLKKPDASTQRSVEKQREQSALIDIWNLGLDHQGPIYIVGGRIPGELAEEPYQVQSGDLAAFIEVVLAIARAGRMEDVRFPEESQPTEEYLRENIVCVGGPYYNKWTRRLMRECRSPLIFDLSQDDIPLINQMGRVELRVTRVSRSVRGSNIQARLQRFLAPKQGSRITRDHGFFARLRNPLNQEKHIILACGIETHAVLGAVKMVAGLARNVHFLQLHEALVQTASRDAEATDLKDFFILSTFEVYENGSVAQDTIDSQIGGILIDWQPAGFQLQGTPPLED